MHKLAGSAYVVLRPLHFVYVGEIIVFNKSVPIELKQKIFTLIKNGACVFALALLHHLRFMRNAIKRKVHQFQFVQFAICFENALYVKENLTDDEVVDVVVHCLAELLHVELRILSQHLLLSQHHTNVMRHVRVIQRRYPFLYIDCHLVQHIQHLLRRHMNHTVEIKEQISHLL